MKHVVGSTLKISDKSQVVASHPVISTALVNIVANHGARLTAASSGVDLGLDVSNDLRKVRTKTRERWSKAMRRDGNMRRLRFKKARTRVFRQAVAPAALYDLPVAGCPQSRLAHYRAKLASHMGKKSGMRGALPTRAVQSFLVLWQNEPQVHQGIRQRWPVITEPLRKPASRWRRVHWFLASDFCTLADQHYQIDEPELLKAPSG